MRSDSCRRTTSKIANFNAAVSSSPDSRIASGRLYAEDEVSYWLRNHMRCCANDSGTGCVAERSRATRRGRDSPPVCDSSRAASASTVGASNSARTATEMPSSVPIRATTRVALSELPPSAKKSSSRPTLASSSTCAKTAATVSCTGVSGARKARVCTAGAGSARRSSFPLTVNGIRSSTTNAAGTM
ncbi:hypothetical protein NWFMUON74_64200 [Nocardia wallacei]|uniref:Uncharacterized protein n=1 Tax=Nocardia wallacei TaxID=480035 RepID=A0A7G1KTR5_9NOCA|nr:hypothetical protein NWFMUON74_64200 [Nocardia wallacei]